jgi:hypothetical protein
MPFSKTKQMAVSTLFQELLSPRQSTTRDISFKTTHPEKNVSNGMLYHWLAGGNACRLPLKVINMQ